MNRELLDVLARAVRASQTEAECRRRFRDSRTEADRRVLVQWERTAADARRAALEALGEVCSA